MGGGWGGEGIDEQYVNLVSLLEIKLLISPLK